MWFQPGLRNRAEGNPNNPRNHRLRRLNKQAIRAEARTTSPILNPAEPARLSQDAERVEGHRTGWLDLAKQETRTANLSILAQQANAALCRWRFGRSGISHRAGERYLPNTGNWPNAKSGNRRRRGTTGLTSLGFNSPAAQEHHFESQRNQTWDAMLRGSSGGLGKPSPLTRRWSRMRGAMGSTPTSVPP